MLNGSTPTIHHSTLNIQHSMSQSLPFDLTLPFAVLLGSNLGGDHGQCAKGGSRSPAGDGVAGVRRDDRARESEAEVAEVINPSAARAPSRRRSLDALQPARSDDLSANRAHLRDQARRYALGAGAELLQERLPLAAAVGSE